MKDGDLFNPAWWIVNGGVGGLVVIILWRVLIFLKPLVTKFFTWLEAWFANDMSTKDKLCENCDKNTALLADLSASNKTQVQLLNSIVEKVK